MTKCFDPGNCGITQCNRTKISLKVSISNGSRSDMLICTFHAVKTFTIHSYLYITYNLDWCGICGFTKLTYERKHTVVEVIYILFSYVRQDLLHIKQFKILILR